ncbi:hypothetical protein [Mucilaginibacter sp. L3T2-6]|uniref:hypothetical protein n=1 Tax=Mucilaginibacter sp. L3T2-6 TaxID=3062491 RepID=UPI002675019B|nr:hypothetical protein [Mucilaginibacter sp. L3T2-6]MDO3642524.1 hypothetical protein [Mucilaginibacter sp. L3T2-6]MDV6215080.1 hypothetical protein [Mucilaginibacter sp. L3T2-6]
MKASFFLALLCLASLSIFVGWMKFQHNNDNLSISVTDTDDTYALSAKFDENYTGRVQDYINHSIKPTDLFRSARDYFNVITRLKDNTEFHIKESPGELEVEFDKKKNSYASYQRIRKMCEGISNLLKGEKTDNKK